MKLLQEENQILWREIEFIKAWEADLISKLDLDSQTMSQYTISPLGSWTFLFGEIPNKPDRNPLVPVLNFQPIFD